MCSSSKLKKVNEVNKYFKWKSKKGYSIGSLFMDQAWHLNSKDLKIID